MGSYRQVRKSAREAAEDDAPPSKKQKKPKARAKGKAKPVQTTAAADKHHEPVQTTAGDKDHEPVQTTGDEDHKPVQTTTAGDKDHKPVQTTARDEDHKPKKPKSKKASTKEPVAADLGAEEPLQEGLQIHWDRQVSCHAIT